MRTGIGMYSIDVNSAGVNTSAVRLLRSKIRLIPDTQF